MDVEAVAKDMHVRNVTSYQSEPALVEWLWATDPEVREFWLDRAREVASCLGFQ